MAISRRERVVLVTGASTGIGLALAMRLMTTDYRLVLTARASSLARFDKVGIVASERVWLRPLDVTMPEQADLLIDEVVAAWGGVDILVNNAGVAFRSVMEHLEDEDEKCQFEINYLGPLHLIRLVLPKMRARRWGYIINISSVGGMMAMPTMGGYSASKFALEGASEALYYELKPWGIRVSLVEPGFVNSSSFMNARFSRKSTRSFNDPGDPYHRYYTEMIGFITRCMNMSPTTPQHIANKIVRLMERRSPPLRVAGTPDAVFFQLVRRLLPSRLYHYICYRGLPRVQDWVRDAPEKGE